MTGPYKGNTDSANRLNAARKAAGFKSTRDAAVRYGWQPGLYCAQETAQRLFDAETGLAYAGAFGVSLTWLMEGRGQRPVTDRARETRFKLRKHVANAPARDAAGPATGDASAGRLSEPVERRTRNRLKQAILSAEENGQSDLSREAAIYYAEVYAIEVINWLMSG